MLIVKQRNIKNMQNKITKIVVVIAIVVFALIAFNKQSADETGPIKIGSISALTGAGSTIGEEERRGVYLAVQQANKNGGINGRQIELISEDLSIDKISKAASVAHKLLDIDNVHAIVGTQWNEPAEPIVPIIEKAQVPMVGADISDQLEKDANYEYLFSTWYDNRVGIKEILKYAQAHNMKKIIIVKSISGGFWEWTASLMKEYAPNYNVEIVATFDLGNPMTLDFKTELLKAKQVTADAVFMVTSDYNQCVFLKQKEELGYNIPSLGTESSGDETSVTTCPRLMENRMWSTPRALPSHEKFIAEYHAEFGENPKFPSAITAYDAANVIIEALRQTDGARGEKLKDAIKNIDIPGASVDRVRFNEKGYLVTPADTFEMKTMRGDAVVDAD